MLCIGNKLSCDNLTCSLGYNFFVIKMPDATSDELLNANDEYYLLFA